MTACVAAYVSACLAILANGKAALPAEHRKRDLNDVRSFDIFAAGLSKAVDLGDDFLENWNVLSYLVHHLCTPRRTTT